jgi:hypothetical protein
MYRGLLPLRSVSISRQQTTLPTTFSLATHQWYGSSVGRFHNSHTMGSVNESAQLPTQSSLPLPLPPVLPDFATGLNRVVRAVQTIATAASSTPLSAAGGTRTSSEPLSTISTSSISLPSSPLSSLWTFASTLATGRLPIPIAGMPSIPTTLPTLVTDVAKVVAPMAVSVARQLLIRPQVFGDTAVPPQAHGVSATPFSSPSSVNSTTTTTRRTTSASTGTLSVSSSVPITSGTGQWNYTPVPLTMLQRSFLAMGSAALALANTYRGRWFISSA